MSRSFYRRHIGLAESDIKNMLKELGCRSLEELIDKTAPAEILNCKKWKAPFALSEAESLKLVHSYSEKNKIFKNYIGMGYYETRLPCVLQRNILENPIWLSSYTPYQSEISQGRLQALLNFQTMITELTEMDTANSSLLDEGTAGAEAVSMAFNNRSKDFSKSVFMDINTFPQTKAVIKTRAQSLQLQVIEGSLENFNPDDSIFCVVISYPDSTGAVRDLSKLCKKASEKEILIIFIADLLSLALFKTPGSMGADIVAGSCQRFGIPLFFGGPHSAYIATKNQYIRSLPGRIVGVSKDRHGKPALRLAIQTREQHIRREKATSNICTAQALLAILSGMYSVYHGPEGLKKIALNIHKLAFYLRENLLKMQFHLQNTNAFFDTIQIKLKPKIAQLFYEAFLENKINTALISAKDSKTTLLSFSINETTAKKDIDEILLIIQKQIQKNKNELSNYQACFSKNSSPSYLEENEVSDSFLKKTTPDFLIRKSPCLKHPVFQKYHCENQMLRYIHRLQAGDLSLTHSMIPLGSCTMKLNATAQLIPVSWTGFSHIHPFAPKNQSLGYQVLFQDLKNYLCEITGFSDISFQPNAGSQGEYTGLLMIKKYHETKKETQRKICLIPSSAHGTNPASATMAGLTPVTVKCDKDGSISHSDLKEKIQKHQKQLSCLMLTFPSTFGVFEDHIPKICQWIHSAGGLVYLDGANMNALIGISRPADWGADVCHLNLHKTFCIPHGGGGPGAGPVLANDKLKEFLPDHPFRLDRKSKQSISAVSSAPYGSAGILMISWAYIRLMGKKGLTKATHTAILNANYIAKKLSSHYSILYTGKNKLVAHECIVDFRKFKNTAEIDVNDVAKRLMDYGFHAPTMSWPVPGTLMIEPTESEDKEELDRFCSALIQIRKEIQEIEDKKFDKKTNILKNAPHCLEDGLAEKWSFPYSKQKAFFPLEWVKERKFWPVVSRVENAYGDINLFCSCPPIS